MIPTSPDELAALLGAATVFLGALGAFLYVSPGRAWRMALRSLEKRVDYLEERLEQRDADVAKLEAELRRSRTIRAILENLLRAAGLEVPRFAPGQHPELAPERRTSPPVVVVDTHATEQEEPPA